MYICNKETGYALVNMTPHDLHFYLDGDPGAHEDREPDYTIPRSGIIPRMTSNKQEKVMIKGGIPVWTHSRFSGIDFPQWKSGVLWTDFHKVVPGEPHLRGIIVARYVAEYLKSIEYDWLGGVYTVDTGPLGAVRSNKEDTKGKILGSKRLEVWIEPYL